MKGTITFIITGGAQGIGRIVAEEALAAGHRVAILDFDEEALAEERAKYGKNALNWLGIFCDVTCEEQVKEAFDETLARFGRIDVLVNNAAIHANGPVEELSTEAWKRVIDVNLTGPFLCSRTCIAELKKNRGSIINLCSTRAFMSEPGTEAYSASKGGVFALTHSLAVSLGPDVRVNSISPGWIDVSAVRKSSVARQEKLSPADHSQHPAGRVGEGRDIARMVLFLCDPENSFITGQNFIVDGGMTRKMIYL